MTQHPYWLQKNVDPQQAPCIKVLRKSKRERYGSYTFPDQNLKVD